MMNIKDFELSKPSYAVWNINSQVKPRNQMQSQSQN